MIQCKTIIGFGSPNKQGKEVCHGAPLGEDEVYLTRVKLGWTHPAFEIPKDIYQAWDKTERGATLEQNWNDEFAAYQQAHPELAKEFQRRLKGDLPPDFSTNVKDLLAQFNQAEHTVASRKASFMVLQKFTKWLPEMLGGSADLAGSNLTITNQSKGISADDANGNYLYYGVREFAMAAIMNGIRLHGGFVPYGGTFLMFMEYARNAIRMAALMKQQSIYVFTHDSIGLGEDGPTHQPVEQIASLRVTPNVATWRPADAVETVVAWGAAVEKIDGPTALILSRQNLPHQTRNEQQLADIARGGYILQDCEGNPELIIIATGSEVDLCRQTCLQLQNEGVAARLVSMPCVEVFDQQDSEYRESVLPTNVRNRLAVEAAQPDTWYRFVGLDGDVVGVNKFGESAPANELFKEYGFTQENIYNTAKNLLN